MNELMDSTLSKFKHDILHELNKYVQAKHLTAGQKLGITSYLQAEAFKFALHVQEQLDDVSFPCLRSHNNLSNQSCLSESHIEPLPQKTRKSKSGSPNSKSRRPKSSTNKRHLPQQAHHEMASRKTEEPDVKHEVAAAQTEELTAA